MEAPKNQESQQKLEADQERLKSNKKKKKAQKLRKVLKERLNVDCVGMLCPEYGNAADDDSLEEVNTAPETE